MIRKSLLRSGLVGFAGLLLVIGGIFSPLTSAPKIAHAQFDDPAILAALTAIAAHTGATAVTTGSTAVSAGGSFTISNVLNGIAWTVAKQMIQTMTKSIVNWINTGYQGSPGFVTNLNSTLLGVSNAAADSFITQLASNGSIKSPFQTQVASAVQSTYNQQTNGGFFASNPYTLNQVTSNPSGFLGGDFSQGGFDAWMSAWSNPANNPYGAYMIANNALGSQVSNAQSTQKTELQWANGFLSFRGNCAVAGSGSSAVGIPLSTNNNCLSYNIQTPGSVVESQLENTLGSPVRQLELANSINEIIGAAVTQLTTSVLGSTGLSGLSKNSAANNNIAPINVVTNPSNYGQATQSAVTGLQQTVAQQQTQVQQYQTNWQTIQNAAQNAENALSSSTCYPNAQATIASTVQPVLTQATNALSEASTALQQLSSLQSMIANANPSDSNAALTISNTYQAYLSSPNVPSVTDISDSTIDSTDSGTATPASLYTQMTNLATQAQQGCSHGIQ